MADATLYLFDGYNLLHAGPYESRGELVDALASYVAMRGARGVVVFDGVGEDARRGPLEVRYAPHADTLLERLAAEHRDTRAGAARDERRDRRGGRGRIGGEADLADFFRDLEPASHRDERPAGLAGKLDEETRSRLERLRRGE